MNELHFTEYIRSNLPLNDKQMEQLCHRSKVLEVKRGDFLLRQGETCTHRLFVERGSVREYFIDERGREHLLLFAVEGWFLMNVESVFFGKPSSYFIQATEDSRILLLNEQQVQTLGGEDCTFAAFSKNLLSEHIQTLQRRITSLQSDTAEERYLHFVATYPEIMLRVPQTMVASFLGITPESLSRIRKGLAHKNFSARIRS